LTSSGVQARRRAIWRPARPRWSGLFWRIFRKANPLSLAQPSRSIHSSLLMASIA